MPTVQKPKTLSLLSYQEAANPSMKEAERLILYLSMKHHAIHCCAVLNKFMGYVAKQIENQYVVDNVHIVAAKSMTGWETLMIIMKC